MVVARDIITTTLFAVLNVLRGVAIGRISHAATQPLSVDEIPTVDNRDAQLRNVAVKCYWHLSMS